MYKYIYIDIYAFGWWKFLIALTFVIMIMFTIFDADVNVKFLTYTCKSLLIRRSTLLLLLFYVRSFRVIFLKDIMNLCR